MDYEVEKIMKQRVFSKEDINICKDHLASKLRTIKPDEVDIKLVLLAIRLFEQLFNRSHHDL
jgi:hypothetical protein